MKLEEVKPIRGYLLIEPAESESEQKAKKVGIILADIVEQDLPQIGTVLKVGDTMITDYGAVIDSPVKTGDRIVFKKWGGNEFKIEDKKYYFIRFDDILGTC